MNFVSNQDVTPASRRLSCEPRRFGGILPRRGSLVGPFGRPIWNHLWIADNLAVGPPGHG